MSETENERLRRNVRLQRLGINPADRDCDISWLSTALGSEREKILDRWLNAATDQPFHRSRRQHAVSDDIPNLYDALVEWLHAAENSSLKAAQSFEASGIPAVSRNHAQHRSSEGLEPADIIVEFRLFRREICSVMMERVPEDVPSSDVLLAESLVSDALDRAASIGLEALMRHFENIRQEFMLTSVHEVRQPITVIRATAQYAERMIQNGNPDQERLQDLLQQVRNSADRLDELLGLMVESSGVALGFIDLNTEEFDLSKLIDDVIGGMGPDVIERVTVDVDLDGGSTIAADRFKIYQVLVNLLSNSVKYSPNGTEIKLRAHREGEMVHMEIQDLGIGISESEQRRLFHRYSRGDEALSQGIEGLGLGLYLCHGIVEAHNGTIWAESEGRWKGTTMHVQLPIQSEVISDDEKRSSASH